MRRGVKHGAKIQKHDSERKKETEPEGNGANKAVENSCARWAAAYPLPQLTRANSYRQRRGRRRAPKIEDARRHKMAKKGTKKRHSQKVGSNPRNVKRLDHSLRGPENLLDKSNYSRPIPPRSPMRRKKKKRPERVKARSRTYAFRRGQRPDLARRDSPDQSESRAKVNFRRLDLFRLSIKYCIHRLY